MTKKWFQIGLAGIFLFSLALRFWGLGRFNTLVFDEVYYAKFGNDYLTHVPFFDGHPPLGKYMIAVGIWLGSHVPFGQDTVNGLTGSLLSPWSYRWINAFSGSFIPLIIAGIAYQLSYRRSFALLAGFFTACDGIFIVESRYALINIYIVLFGLLGQWLFLVALANYKQRHIYLALAGIAFGASIATKWNGLFFLIGIYLIWIINWVWQWIIKATSQTTNVIDDLFTSSKSSSTIASVSELQSTAKIPLLQNLTQINILQIAFFLGIIPLTIYSLIWIPHLQLDTKYGFIEVHKQILEFHERLGGNNAKVHPYCAAWYKWPLMTRPMAYYYQTARSVTDPLPVFGPTLPPGAGKVIYDVHAMGNPFLWWFGAAAILFLIGMLVIQLAIPSVKQKRFSLPTTLDVDTWIALYLVVNYATNLVPWIKVTRCAFIYHYMTAVVFTFLAIAWFVDRCLYSYYRPLRALGITISFLIVLALVFWIPVYLGLPLSPEGYKARMWFNSWI
ncbi:phospholipid carrier-dependent glycosyltransferase [Nostocaceae cyanobacterium CENA369]|uniref:Polyprenol-phosphate-mannose--protein mannosyltransferase n=1 Tax=Dendronalium phyllosphericum CENA369 TaxID=1725256 RepID=A0A8J7LEJ2_9NOST|nr:phospholipid carrier-dependent glycosyltransferase [Dendronalium phyllosphericum]MBH8574987.1 phospholipid carrier-dependent glycosyltransferase [Dendronalium phyllosphericum CENA369]